MRPLPSHRSAPGARSRQGAGGGETDARILVVDDEPQIRALVKEALGRRGYEVDACEGGSAALRILESHAVDLLLTDLRMPGMDGLELIQRARLLAPHCGSVLVTAFASTETAIEALRLGADDYLTKPFTLDDLRGVVGRVLHTRSLQRAHDQTSHDVRAEAEVLRRRSRAVEADLARTRADLDVSRTHLERRVRDLEFVQELTRLLAREGDIERVLQTTARIVTTRFQAQVVSLQVDLGDGVRTAEYVAGARDPMLSTLAAELLRSTARRSERVVADVVLGHGRPLEALSTSLRRGDRRVGGLALLRSPQASRDEQGDELLLGLLPQALAVALEAEIHRRSTEQGALQVARGILDTLEQRGSLYPGRRERLQRIARALCEAAGVSPRLAGVVELAASLQDLGKVSLPEETLQRRGPLTGPERLVLHQHPVVAARILSPFGEAAAFVRHHCERPDGAGYPDGLEREAIPLGAGLVGLAGAYEAMTSPRPYRASLSRRKALREIRSLRDRQFLPEAVDALLEVAPSAL